VSRCGSASCSNACRLSSGACATMSGSPLEAVADRRRIESRPGPLPATAPAEVTCPPLTPPLPNPDFGTRRTSTRRPFHRSAVRAGNHAAAGRAGRRRAG
jgi:hypothetical protein